MGASTAFTLFINFVQSLFGSSILCSLKTISARLATSKTLKSLPLFFLRVARISVLGPAFKFQPGPFFVVHLRVAGAESKHFSPGLYGVDCITVGPCSGGPNGA